MKPLTVTTPDGRVLEAMDSEVGATPLVFHHGTPGSAFAWTRMATAAEDLDLRLITYSRPGYGASTPRPDGATTASIADDTGDTVAVLDHLGLDDFLTLGWSGGGPRALACAALLPDRCRAAAAGVSLAPPSEYDGDISEGMGQENIDELAAAQEGAAELTEYLTREVGGIASITADQVADVLGTLVPPVDHAALTGDLAEWLATGMRASARQGVVGWRDDDLALFRAWGFELADITTPVAIWHGSEDKMVPFGHGLWLVKNLPSARAHLAEGEGHLSLLQHVHEILADLAVLGR